MQKWLLISSLLLLSACTEQAVDINEDYKARLNTVLRDAPDKPALKNIQVPVVSQLESHVDKLSQSRFSLALAM